MTIIVKHRRTGNEYILLGINGEVDKVNPSRFISELFSQEKSEISCSVTVCDVRGNIFLAYIDDLLVTEIDGKKLADILPEPTFESVDQDIYQQQTDDFADEEDLADQSFDNSEDASTESTISFTSSQGSSQQNDDEDDDWI